MKRQAVPREERLGERDSPHREDLPRLTERTGC